MLYKSQLLCQWHYFLTTDAAVLGRDSKYVYEYTGSYIRQNEAITEAVAYSTTNQHLLSFRRNRLSSRIADRLYFSIKTVLYARLVESVYTAL